MRKKSFDILRLTCICCLTLVHSNKAYAEVPLKTGVVYQIEEKDPDTGKWSKPTFDTLSAADGRLIPNIPMGTSGWIAASFAEGKEESEFTYNSRNRFESVMARFSGVKELPEMYRDTFSALPAQSTSKTKIISRSESELTLEVTQFIQGFPVPPVTVRVRQVPEFSKVILNIESLKEDRSNRYTHGAASDSEKKLSDSVVQIISEDGDEDSTSVSNTSGGTGFFLSKEGYFLTNHHVAEVVPNCLKKLKCKMKIRIIQGDKVVIKEVGATLFSASKEHDFAFFKLHLPEDLKITPLEIERSEIKGDLLTLGYPADRVSDDPEKIDITYSKGKLLGFHGRALQTSNYISGGASGSPILNESSHKVVGILSNGVGVEKSDGRGMPGIARPMATLEREFTLSDFIDGTKQKRIDSLILELSKAKTFEESRAVLTKYGNEKTFFGLSELKTFLTCHSEPGVRKAILEYLENVGYLPGVTSFDPSRVNSCALPLNIPKDTDANFGETPDVIKAPTH